MSTLTGTWAPDTLQGGADADLLSGRGADDWLMGLGGDDTLLGGEGRDHLWGDAGGDRLEGGAGNDFLNVDGGGGDVVLGGAGDDELWVDDATESGFSKLVGGEGADRITITEDQRLIEVKVSGGAGNDSVEAYSAAAATIRTGGGRDWVWLQRGAYRLSLGADQDVLEVSSAYGVTVAVDDFSVARGDRDSLVLKNAMANTLVGWDKSTNPCASGYARLFQQGDDTLVQLDANGGGDSWFTLVTLENVRADDLNAYNLGGYSSEAASIRSFRYIGAETTDLLMGGAGRDTLEGRGGTDRIDGGLGGDTMAGGAGDDRIYDDYGSDLFIGGAGNDTLTAHRLSNANRGDEDHITMRAGTGNDQLYHFSSGGDASTLLLNGGSGNDWFAIGGAQAATLIGGLGADTIGSIAGSELIVYRSVADSTGALHDLITDLASSDRIGLSGIDANSGLDGDQSFVLVEALSGHAGEVALRYDAALDLTFLEGDVDGGAADLVITIEGDATGHNSFVL